MKKIKNKEVFSNKPIKPLCKPGTVLSKPIKTEEEKSKNATNNKDDKKENMVKNDLKKKNLLII